jgi:hypothetical protein
VSPGRDVAASGRTGRQSCPSLAIPGRRGLPRRAPASRRSIRARPLSRDVTGARTTWNRDCGRRRMGSGPSAVGVDERHVQGTGGGTSVVDACVAHRCRRASPVADGADVLDRIRRHLCVRGGPLAASPEIGVISRVRSRWGSSSAPVTTTHFPSGADDTRGTRGDIMETDRRPPSEMHSTGTQLLRGE